MSTAHSRLAGQRAWLQATAQSSHAALLVLGAFVSSQQAFTSQEIPRSQSRCFLLSPRIAQHAQPSSGCNKPAHHCTTDEVAQGLTALGWVQERKASKLERKKQAQAESASGPTTQASAGSSDPATKSPSASPAVAEATNSAVHSAQPSQTDCSLDESAQAAQDIAGGRTAEHRHSRSPSDASGQIQEPNQGPETQHDGQHQLSVNTDRSDAEPSEPYDVLQEFESLSPMLPDMPKHETGDDLAGLFQAAFATCDKQMSPHGRPPQSPFSSHNQDQEEEEEDYSLYNDADEVMGGDEVEGTVLDASDEEEGEKGGEVAGVLLESFMGDAEHAAHLQASHHAQVCSMHSTVAPLSVI